VWDDGARPLHLAPRELLSIVFTLYIARLIYCDMEEKTPEKAAAVWAAQRLLYVFALFCIQSLCHWLYISRDMPSGKLSSPSCSDN
jgi:hypothetical protein